MDVDGPSQRLMTCRDAAESGGRLAYDSFRTSVSVETKGTSRMDTVTEVDRSVQRHIIERIANQFPGEPIVGEEATSDPELPEVNQVDSPPESGPAWIIDPIDGTNNYVTGNQVWATSVAAIRDQRPVAAANSMPAMDACYLAGPHDQVSVVDSEVSATRNGQPLTPSQRTDQARWLINPIFGLADRDRSALPAVVRTIMEEFGDMRRVGCAQAVLSRVAAGELDAAVSTVSLNSWDSAAGVHLIREAGGTVTDIRGNRWRIGAEGLIASSGCDHARLVRSFGPH